LALVFVQPTSKRKLSSHLNT